MRTAKWFVLLIAAVMTTLLWGCGSSGGSGGDSTSGGQNPVDPDTGISYALSSECVRCHQGFSWSTKAVADYLASKHVIHSSNINAASPAECLGCHDPLGETGLAAYIDPANVPAEGLAAVGCENCHGPGGEHFGVGPIPNYSPDYTVCGKCHNALYEGHLQYHPLADNILDNYKLSHHYNEGVALSTSGSCKRCHSDEGYRLYIDQTLGLDDNELEAAMAFTPDVGDAPIQCRTCHNPHDGGLRTPASLDNEDSNGDDILVDGVRTDVQILSAQFNLCTSCHMAFLNYIYDNDTGLFTYTLDGTRPPHHSSDPMSPSSRAIWDTHFKYLDPAVPTTVLIPGYNINAAAENACSNCHDSHAGSKFEQDDAQLITEQWAGAEGFHGDYMGPAFEYGCAPCHSPEGLIELTVGGEYAEPSTEVGVIACVACHDLQLRNATDDGFELGDRRASPEFAFDNARTLYAQALEADPDTTETLATVEGLGDNAQCMTCHSGRESTASVNTKIAAPAGPYSFTNIHYLAAGATLFGNMAKGAYEYDDKVYSSKFEHVASNDLCIECHNAHTGELFITDPGLAGATTCDECHDVASVEDIRDIRMNGSLADYDGNASLEGIYYEVQGLISLLEAELNSLGIGYFPDHYPYFWPVGTTDFSNRDNASKLSAAQLKAAYNLQVSKKDPGTYAHNGTYIIEILYDSIEDLGGDVSGLTRDASGHFDAAGEPFRYWDEDGEMRTSCARCHSSEGAIAYVTNGTVEETDFSEYTRGISAGLACEACHTAPFDPTGTTRSVTEVEFPSGVVLNSTNAADFFANDSPLCMNCHQGRESGKSVDRATPGNDGTYRFVNIHYFAAAATLFGSEVTAGYEYAGKTYVTRNTFPSHGGGLDTCADCHTLEMPDHTFEPTLAVCTFCHGGTSFQTLGGKPAQSYADIVTLKADLLARLNALGVTYDELEYPYFGGITTLDQLRAAYNLQVATKDPCGYIHNGDYIKQILFDSIVALGGTPTVTRPGNGG